MFKVNCCFWGCSKWVWEVELVCGSTFETSNLFAGRFVVINFTCEFDETVTDEATGSIENEVFGVEINGEQLNVVVVVDDAFVSCKLDIVTGIEGAIVIGKEEDIEKLWGDDIKVIGDDFEFNWEDVPANDWALEVCKEPLRPIDEIGALFCDITIGVTDDNGRASGKVVEDTGDIDKEEFGWTSLFIMDGSGTGIVVKLLDNEVEDNMVDNKGVDTTVDVVDVDTTDKDGLDNAVDNKDVEAWVGKDSVETTVDNDCVDAIEATLTEEDWVWRLGTNTKCKRNQLKIYSYVRWYVSCMIIYI